jgi:hypothetical protein
MYKFVERCQCENRLGSGFWSRKFPYRTSFEVLPVIRNSSKSGSCFGCGNSAVDFGDFSKKYPAAYLLAHPNLASWEEVAADFYRASFT